jgi:uncharacterized membrane protein
MLIPQFSLRWLLGLTAVMAVVFLVMSWAWQGVTWAVGVSASIVMLALAGVVSAVLFTLVWLVSLGLAALARHSAAARSKEAN